MKNLIIFASQECCSGMSEVSLLNSLCTVERISADCDLVANKAKEFGYNTFVYYLHNNTHPENKRSIAKNVKNCTVVTDDNLKETLLKCDISILLGIPAMQGTADSFADRNYGNNWFDYWLNDQKMGQMGMINVLLSAYGIPVACVMSDVAGCKEAESIFKDAEFVVSVYDSIICPGGWQCCTPYPIKTVHENLSRAICVAFEKSLTTPSAPKLPLTAKVEYMRTDFCDVACSYNPNVERLDARTVSWQISKINTLLDLALRGEE